MFAEVRWDAIELFSCLLHEDFGLDSISVLGAMLKIEELFDISVDHVEVAEVSTISDARKLLVDKLSSAPTPHQ